jgi:ankyrin repeat protein
MRVLAAVLLLAVAVLAMAETDTARSLSEAVARGDESATRHTLEACAATNDCRLESPDSRGMMPLHTAVQLRELGIARQLLMAGAEIDPRSKVGRTPLRDAVDTGQAGMAELLLMWGADTAATDDNGVSPMHSAAASRRPQLVGLLQRYETKGLRFGGSTRTAAVVLLLAGLVCGFGAVSRAVRRRESLKLHGTEYADAGFAVWLQDQNDHPIRRGKSGSL